MSFANMTTSGVKKLSGCQSKDNFKYMHKQKCPKGAYGLDYDFVILSRMKHKGVFIDAPVAIIDYKTSEEGRLLFSHVASYDYEVSVNGKRVFIVTGPHDANPTPESPFVITEFTGGDPKPNPPKYNVDHAETCRSWGEYWDWEGKVRREIKVESQVRECSERTGASR